MEKLVQRWAKVPARQRYALLAIVFVVLVGGYWYLFYSDKSTQLDRLESEYTNLENKRAEKQAYVDNLAKYEARLTELQQDLNVARSQLPDHEDVAQLLAQLGNKARQSGLTIDRFEPQGETAKDFVAEIRFLMEIRGSYHEIGTFIDAVGKLDRIINVMDISMETPKTENKKIVVKGAFTIKTYRYIGAPAAGQP